MRLKHFNDFFLSRFRPSCNEDWKAFVWSYAAILPSQVDTVSVQIDFESKLAFVWWTSGIHREQKGSQAVGAAVEDNVNIG